MNESDRKTILDNIPQLIKLTSYKELKEYCQFDNLLSDLMVRNIENSSNNDHERHRKLLEKITRRGPQAFEKFKKICQNYFLEAYAVLRPQAWHSTEGGNCVRMQRPRSPSPDVNGNPTQWDQVPQFEPYTEHVEYDLKVIKALKPGQATHPMVETYRMDSKHRGVLFLVNIIDFPSAKRKRNGAKRDKEMMISLFRQFGFTIFYYENLIPNQLMVLIKKLQNSQYLRKADCLVFGMLTHGNFQNNTTYAEFANGGFNDIEHIVANFNNVNCYFLQNKPKIFLFPFCRGKSTDKGVESRNIENLLGNRIERDGTDEREIRIASTSDIFLVFATVPGFETHRDTNYGSWYIQMFCKVLAEHAHDTSWEDLLKIVGAEVSKWISDEGGMQTPSHDNRGFLKALYFNPGYVKSYAE